MLVIWPQSELDQRSRIGSGLGLPVVIGLIPLHRLLRSIIPYAGRFPRQVVLANQGFLNL